MDCYMSICFHLYTLKRSVELITSKSFAQVQGRQVCGRRPNEGPNLLKENLPHVFEDCVQEVFFQICRIKLESNPVWFTYSGNRVCLQRGKMCSVVCVLCVNDDPTLNPYMDRSGFDAQTHTDSPATAVLVGWSRFS